MRTKKDVLSDLRYIDEALMNTKKARQALEQELLSMDVLGRNDQYSIGDAIVLWYSYRKGGDYTAAFVKSGKDSWTSTVRQLGIRSTFADIVQFINKHVYKGHTLVQQSSHTKLDF